MHSRPTPQRPLPPEEVPAFDNAQGRTPQEVREVGQRLIAICGLAVLALAALGLSRLAWRVLW